MNYFIIIFSITVFIFSFLLFKQAAGSMSLRKLNTVSYVFYFQIIIMAFLGSILIATKQADYHYMIKVVDDHHKVFAWLGVLYSMIVMPLSMILLGKLFKIKSIKKKFINYTKKPLKITTGSKLTRFILIVMLIHSFLILIYILKANEQIPILTLIKGKIEQAARERVLVRRSFGGIIYIKNLFGYILMPIFAYYSFIIWKQNRGKFYFLTFIIINTLTLLLLTYDTQKAPVVFFIFGYVIILTMLEGGVSKKTFVLFVGASLFIIGAAYAFTGGGDGLRQITNFKSAFYGRLFISSLGGYVMSLKLFPDIITQPTWYIGTPEFFLNLFDLPNTESARLLMNYIDPEGVKEGTSNIVASYYLGEAYANYGIIGMLISPVIVGFVVQLVHLLTIKAKKDPLNIAFYTFITTKWLLNAGFVNFLYFKIILYPVILLLIVKFSIKLISNKYIVN
jgi:oligosaccharide repeat unit polymerase